MRELPSFSIEKVDKFPIQTKYTKYHEAVAWLKDGEAVVIKGLDQKTCWKIQSNTQNDLVKIATKSIKEADETYTLYLFKKENKKGGK